MYDLIIAWEPEAVYKYAKYDFWFVKVEMCWIRKKWKICPFFYRVLPISAPQILKKTGLTIEAHELIAGFPHSISTGNSRRDFRVQYWIKLRVMSTVINWKFTSLVRVFWGVARFMNDSIVLPNDGVCWGEVRPGFIIDFTMEWVLFISGVDRVVCSLLVPRPLVLFSLKQRIFFVHIELSKFV